MSFAQVGATALRDVRSHVTARQRPPPIREAEQAVFNVPSYGHYLSPDSTLTTSDTEADVSNGV